MAAAVGRAAAPAVAKEELGVLGSAAALAGPGVPAGQVIEGLGGGAGPVRGNALHHGREAGAR